MPKLEQQRLLSLTLKGYESVFNGTVKLNNASKSPLALRAMGGDLQDKVFEQFAPENACQAMLFCESYYLPAKVNCLGTQDVEETLCSVFTDGLDIGEYLLTIKTIKNWKTRKQTVSKIPLPQTRKGLRGLRQIADNYIYLLELLEMELPSSIEGALLLPTNEKREKYPDARLLITTAAQLGIPIGILGIQPQNIGQLALPIMEIIQADNQVRQRLVDNPPSGTNLIVTDEGEILRKPPKIFFDGTGQEMLFDENGQISVIPTGGKKRKKALGLYRELKTLRQQQAYWRAEYRRRTEKITTNQNCLPQSLVRKAAAIKTKLKEGGASYGDRVFNFAFMEKGAPVIPIKIPATLPSLIWQAAYQLEPNACGGVPMVRIDALRNPDNSLSIIEFNPCWVDNMAALAVFSETYGIDFSVIEVLIETLCEEAEKKLGQRLGNNLTLVYCSQAVGCKRDEIYSLKDRLESRGKFGEIVVSPFREVKINNNDQISVNGTPVSILYLNGSFSMAQESVTEQRAVAFVQKAQAAGKLVLAPAQFQIFDRKESLIQLSQNGLSLVTPTSLISSELTFPLIAKPTSSESLKGIKIITKPEELTETNWEGYVFQEFRPVVRSRVVCFNAETNTIFQPDQVYEKINLWIIGNQVVGALATYSLKPLISDAGYNLPIPWEEI